MKVAPVPTPLALPAAPLPASVKVRPPGDTALTRLFPESLTKAHPLAFAVMPWGLLKAAAVPTPSAYAAKPFPARVFTVPLRRFSARRALLPQSRMYRSPRDSSGAALMATGLLKRARARLLPSTKPGTPTPPASRATAPLGSSRRTTWFPVSPMYANPVAFTSRPQTLLKEALEPAPLAEPTAPVPACVPRVPSEGLRMRTLLLFLSVKSRAPWKALQAI